MPTTPTAFQMTETGEILPEKENNTYLQIAFEKSRGISTGEEESSSIILPLTSLCEILKPTSGLARAEHGSEFIIWWNEPEDRDRENPMNWSEGKKWVNICTISVITFVV